MDERDEAANQASVLRRRFKRSSLTPEEWLPPPTAGDLVRGVAAELEVSRLEDIESGQGVSRSLWESTRRRTT